MTIFAPAPAPLTLPAGFTRTHDTYVGASRYVIFTSPNSDAAYAVTYGHCYPGRIVRSCAGDMFALGDTGREYDAFTI
jgi:hypothetical protein